MTDGFWQARRADKRCGLVWWQANAPPTEAGAVAAMPDDLRAAAVRALMVVGDLDGASSDQRFGHALGQQTRRLRLKIDQLIDRGVGGDLALQRLESDMVHGGVPSSPEIGEPVVTDAVEAAWQHVQEKTADELVGRERHGLEPVAAFDAVVLTWGVPGSLSLLGDKGLD